MLERPVYAGRWLLLTLGLLAALYAIGQYRSRPAAPLPADAPAQQFSGTRALAQLQQLVGNDRTHPVGSAEDVRIREQLLAALKQLGLDPQVQATWSCSDYGECAFVRNIVARIEGTEAGKGVLLVAHYDSVAAGPGAGDDGAAVASILEIARILRAGPKLRRSVILLLDEGEEEGLLGAQAFYTEHPWRQDVGGVVNLEGRGDTGPSNMFETSGHNGWLIRALSDSVPRPVMTSLFPTIYELLPNDTDLSVFKRNGVPGVNFAFIGGAARYHTPVDDIAHLDPRTVQHQGDNALAAVRALAEANIDVHPADDVVFFDVLSLGVVRWPLRWTKFLALASLGLILASVVILRRRRAVRLGTVALQAFIFVLGLLMTAGMAFGLVRGLFSTGAFSGTWIATPGPAIGACWALGLAISVLTTRVLRRVDANAVWLGVWLILSALGVALGFALPGASFLLVAPTLVASVIGFLWLPTRGPPGRGLPAVLPALAMGLVWFPVTQQLYDALGLMALVGIAVIALLIGASLSPLLAALERRAQWESFGVAFVAMLILAIAAAYLPPHSPTVPGRLSLTLYQEPERNRSQWLLLCDDRKVPDALQQQAEFSKQPQRVPPWQPEQRYVAPASIAPAPAPDVQILQQTESGGQREVRLHLASRREAPLLQLAFPPGTRLQVVMLDGHPVTALGKRGLKRSGGWLVYAFWTVPPEGIEVSLTLSGTERVAVTVSDESFGLPAEATRLLLASPPWGAPIRHGDVFIVARDVQL